MFLIKFNETAKPALHVKYYISVADDVITKIWFYLQDKTEPNRRFQKKNRTETETAIFFKTEPKFKNPFRTSLILT